MWKAAQRLCGAQNNENRKTWVLFCFSRAGVRCAGTGLRDRVNWDCLSARAWSQSDAMAAFSICNRIQQRHQTRLFTLGWWESRVDGWLDGWESTRVGCTGWVNYSIIPLNYLSGVWESENLLITCLLSGPDATEKTRTLSCKPFRISHCMLQWAIKARNENTAPRPSHSVVAQCHHLNCASIVIDLDTHSISLWNTAGAN